MVEHSPIRFVVHILDKKAVFAVWQTVATEITVDLPKGTKSLSEIHTHFTYHIRILINAFPLKFDFLAALVVEVHFEDPFPPISAHQHEVFPSLEIEMQRIHAFLLVVAVDPAVAIGSVLDDDHDAAPDIIIAVFIVIFLVFLYEVQNALRSALFYGEFAQRDAAFGLFYDTPQRVETVVYAEELGSAKLSL